MNLQSKKIAVIGLGYVGLPLSVEFGKITSVLGFDINQSRISALQAGLDATHEISSQELISAKYLEFTSDSEQLRSCDIFIITVPTPINNVSRTELSQLNDAPGRPTFEAAFLGFLRWLLFQNL
jgi:UDP-N-acetyl-D-galactosamine dehydrogenase